METEKEQHVMRNEIKESAMERNEKNRADKGNTYKEKKRNERTKNRSKEKRGRKRKKNIGRCNSNYIKVEKKARGGIAVG